MKPNLQGDIDHLQCFLMRTIQDIWLRLLFRNAFINRIESATPLKVQGLEGNDSKQHAHRVLFNF